MNYSPTATIEDPALTLCDHTGSPFLRIFPESERLIRTEWVGFISPDTVQFGLERLMQMYDKFPVPCVLFDMRPALGGWHELLPWLLGTHWPRVLQTPVSYSAMIVSRSGLTAFSAHISLLELPQDEYHQVQVFEDEAEARAWIQSLI